MQVMLSILLPCTYAMNFNIDMNMNKFIYICIHRLSGFRQLKVFKIIMYFLHSFKICIYNCKSKLPNDN